ncbi:phage tail protein [Paenibacillus lautus]|uniref:phage tail protein n=1 Tax=Paenibacillus lautus TaxID=1401 RepID=UPI003D288E59
MSSNTPNLGLLKKDPMVDGNETFNIETMLNENWDKVDEAVGNIKVPDASLTEKGIVQLSNSTNGTRENVAATEKAVKDAALQAKSYTDQQISLVTETGIPKLVSYPLLVTATADNQKVFEIPLDLFDANTDTLLVAINRAVLDSTQYTVTNTIRNESGEVTQRAKITLLSGVASSSEVTMVVLKNVPIGPEGAINGAVLATNSVPINRVNGLQDQLDETFQAGNERKAEVVAALVAIGIQASTSETWAQLIPKIAAIIRASGNATAADLLVGKSASNSSGPFNGGMPDRSAENNHMPGLESTVWAGDRFFVKPPHGYFNGSSWVTAGVPGLTANNLRSGVNVAGLVGTLVEGRPVIKGYGIVDVNDRYSLNIPIPQGFTPGVVRVWRDYQGEPAGTPIYLGMVPSDPTIGNPWFWRSPNDLRWYLLSGSFIYGLGNKYRPDCVQLSGGFATDGSTGQPIGNHYEIYALN